MCENVEVFSSCWGRHLH